MEKFMLAKDFIKLCKFAVERGNLDPKKTYCEFTWWNKTFKPITSIDGDYATKETYFIVGDSECNSWKVTRSNEPTPCGFYITSDSVWIDRVVHRPLTLHEVMHWADEYNGEGTIGFLFSNSPVNYWVGINPFRTRIYKNFAGETILCFYADDRDSGEWKSFNMMKPEHIEIYDDSPKEFEKDGDTPDTINEGDSKDEV